MKKLFSMIFSVSLVLMLVACGGGGGAKEEPKVKYDGEVVEYKLGDYGTIEIPKEYTAKETTEVPGVQVTIIPDKEYRIDFFVFPLGRVTPYTSFKEHVKSLKEANFTPIDKIKVAGKEGITEDGAYYYTIKVPINKAEDVLLINVVSNKMGEKPFAEDLEAPAFKHMIQSIKLK